MADTENGTSSLSASEGDVLEISVTDPVKQGDGVHAFVTYRVSLKTNMSQYRWNTSFVIRRFSDFVWLHDRLSHNNRGIIVPPLPEKNVVEKFRFSAEFIEARRRALDVFMNRIAAHKNLRSSKDLQLFLEASEDVWSMETAKSSEGGLLKTTTTDFFQLFRGVQSSISQVVLGTEKVEEESNPEFETMKAYVASLETNLVEAQRNALKLVKRQKELGSSFSEFGEAMILMGQRESGALGKVLTELGNRSDLLATKSTRQSSDILFAFEEPLKEYVRMAQSVKAVLNDQGVALRHRHELQTDLESKKTKLEKLQIAQATTKPEKILELEKEIDDLTKKFDAATVEYELIVERFKGEMIRFQEEKTRDMGLIFYEFAQSQADLAQEAANMWRTLLPTISAARASNGQ